MITLRSYALKANVIDRCHKEKKRIPIFVGILLALSYQGVESGIPLGIGCLPQKVINGYTVKLG